MSFIKKTLDSMVLKGIIIAILTLLMLIPISLVTALITERAANKESVTEEISEKWGGEQNIIGPVLVVPFKTKIETGVSQTTGTTFYKELTEYAYFLPDSYNVDATVTVEERSRSIYNTLVYQSNNKVNGYFSKPDLAALKVNLGDVQWNDAFILLGIPYMQGITNKITFNMNSNVLEALPGVPFNDMVESGLTLKMPIDPHNTIEKYNFDFNLNLNGSEKFFAAPIGKENNIKIASDWKTISFIGDFLPTTREINNDGFTAEWNVYDYNRNYVQMWTGSNTSRIPEVGVELKYAVNQYQMSMRSVKYAILFIALTFVVFFFVEIITKRRIHPVQYLLVSFALVLFYTLLIALSEHISFHFAYLISAIAIVLMITLYVKTIFVKILPTLAMGAFIAATYIFLYVILQLEDMALLIGAIGLFVTLAGVMYASRKIDWYKEKEN